MSRDAVLHDDEFSDKDLEDHLREAREHLGPMNPERGTSGEKHELPIVIEGLPDIGPDGRFLLWSMEGEDGEIHHELQTSSSRGERRVDARDALNPHILSTLKEFNPFHSRAWMGEYVYSRRNSIRPKIPMQRRKDGGIDYETFPFDLPKSVKVHGVEYAYHSVIGRGGMAGAFLYRSKEHVHEKIVLKVAIMSLLRPYQEVRAIEETTYHAVLNPRFDADGKAISPLARAIHRSDGRKPGAGSRRFVEYIDSVYLRPKMSSDRAVGTFMEYLDWGNLARTIADEQPHKLRESSEKDAYRKFLSKAVQDGVDLAEGLVELHAAGIEHRDLKPENAVRGNDGGLRIIDPGIARGETVRALRAVEERVSARRREDQERNVERDLHAKITNDAKGLYLLAVTRGEGFTRLPEALGRIMEKKTGTYEKRSSDWQKMLSFQQQEEIWKWLQDWQGYQYEPMGVQERTELLQDLARRFRRLEEKHREHFWTLSTDLPKHFTVWRPSKWSMEDLAALESLNASPGADAGTVTADGDMFGNLGERAELGAETMDSGARFKQDIFSLGATLLQLTGLATLPDMNNVVKEGEEKVSVKEIVRRIYEAHLAPDRGIEYHKAGLLSLEQEARLREAEQGSLDRGENLEDPWAPEKQKVQALLDEPGIPRLLGLLWWATLYNPADRPTANELLNGLYQVQADEINEEVQREVEARERARQAAKGEAQEAERAAG
ncbi:MAG: Serine/threonine protein kinase [Parcubacteria group bacterium GW2011_GWA2_53_21]|nr:MAG: Serine/threonine protein kinase [Parcubacteria group bacterium GW2011_GWA2_53_21]